MVQFIITPWQNRTELLRVRRQLYPERFGVKKQSRQRAAKEAGGKHAAMWMFRGGCPHLVESTALLVAAQLGDTMASTLTDLAALCAYITAFNRFITGLLDGEQKGAHKMSMYNLAEKVGLPDSFVELRHQATHEELPSMKQMRRFTQRALDWIWDNYWGPMEDEEPSAGASKTVADAAASKSSGPPADSTTAAAGTAEDDDECVKDLRRYVEETLDSSSKPNEPSGDDKAKMASCIEAWGGPRVLLTLLVLDYDLKTAEGYRRFVRSTFLSGIVRELIAPPPTEPPAPLTTEDLKNGTAIAELNRIREEMDQLVKEARAKKQKVDAQKEKEAEKSQENGGEDVDMEADEDEDEDEALPKKPKWKLWEGEWVPRPAGVI